MAAGNRGDYRSGSCAVVMRRLYQLIGREVGCRFPSKAGGQRGPLANEKPVLANAPESCPSRPPRHGFTAKHFPFTAWWIAIAALRSERIVTLAQVCILRKPGHLSLSYILS